MGSAKGAFLRSGCVYLSVVGLWACSSDEQPSAGSGGMAVQVGALSTCGGAAVDPLTQIKTLQLKVRESKDGKLVNVLKDPQVKTYAPGTSSLNFTNIPAGSPREVTLLGIDASGKPKWFGRRSGVNVKKNDTTTLEMTLMAIEGFTCVGTSSMPNALFPATATMDAGRVLITGGFTNAAADAAGTILESPSNAAYIFDTNTGSFTKLKGQMNAGRAGHAMIYLPKLNQVLIVGGTSKMTVPANGPPTWSASDGVGLTYEVYDIASDKFLAGAESGLNCKKRVFPNLVALTDDYVVSMGGAPWPISSSDDYAKSDLFTSKHGASEKTGRFVDAGNSLQLNGVRGGAAVSYMGPTTNGTSRYFIWGGATIDQNFCPAADGGKCPLETDIVQGEVFIESTEPGTGALYGVGGADIEMGDGSYDKKSSLFFPSLSYVKKTVDPKTQTETFTFLLAGGVRYDPMANPAGWRAPSLDDIYLLDVKEPNEAFKTKRRVTPKKVAGLSSGIYMHQANVAGTGQIVLTGGFSGFGTAATFPVQYYDIPSSKLVSPGSIPASAAFVRRGGHSALTLKNDCILLYGGASQLAVGGLSSTQAAISDVYCPSFLLPP